jgi:hypothetical protein
MAVEAKMMPGAILQLRMGINGHHPGRLGHVREAFDKGEDQ